MTSPAFTDHMGRPIVVVTGMGVVSSLGEGLEENWNKLSSGVSGIHKIERFATNELSTLICGSVDFIGAEANSIVDRTYILAENTTVEALADAEINGEFNGPLFLAAPPAEPDWEDRFELANELTAEQKE